MQLTQYWQVPFGSLAHSIYILISLREVPLFFNKSIYLPFPAVVQLPHGLLSVHCHWSIAAQDNHAEGETHFLLP